MSNLSTGQLIVQSKLLDKLRIGLRQGRDKFKADRIMKAAGAQLDMKPHGVKCLLEIEDPRNNLGNPQQDWRRAPGGQRAQLGRRFGSTTVEMSVEDYSPEAPVDEWDIEATSNRMDLVAKRQVELEDAVIIARERRWVEMLLTQNTVTWTTAALAALNGGSGVKFGAAGSVPIRDLLAMKKALRVLLLGNDPDTLILTYEAAWPLMFDPNIMGASIINAGGGETAAVVGIQQLSKTATQLEQKLSELLDIPYVAIVQGFRETANLGQTSVVDDIGDIDGAGDDDRIWMGRLAPTVMETKSGYTVAASALLEPILYDDLSWSYEKEDKTAIVPVVKSWRKYVPTKTTAAAYGMLTTAVSAFS